MGRPIRNGATGAFKVSIKPQVKTCPEEVGIAPLPLPSGSRVVVLAHCFYPSHDRSLMAAVDKFLKNYKPDAVILLGGMVHEDAFKIVANDEKNLFSKLTGVKMPAEIDEVMGKARLEDRFLSLAKKSGKFIAHFAEVSGAHVYYVPTLTGMLPNEIDILSYVLEQKERADSYAENHPDEAKKGPAIPQKWDEFLGIHNNPNITTLPFGAAIELNGDVVFKINDFRRRNPGTASKEAFRLADQSTVVSFDGKVSSGWMTLPVHTLPENTRRYVQFHEVGHLFDIKAGLGYLRKYDLRTPGIFTGTVVTGNDGKSQLFAWSIPFIVGSDGRRGFVVDGVGYDEAEPWVRAKLLTVPAPKAARNELTARPTTAAKVIATEATKPAKRTAKSK